MFSPGLSGRQSQQEINRLGKENRKKEKGCNPIFLKDTWTRQFCCLPFIYSSTTPTTAMVTILTKAGLGRKKLIFQSTDRHDIFVKKLTEAYPKLASCGGFLLYHTTQGGTNRPLDKVNCTWYHVKDLRRKPISGRGTIYVKPLQKDLDLSIDLTQVSSSKLRNILMTFTLYWKPSWGVESRIFACLDLFQGFPFLLSSIYLSIYPSIYLYF